MENRRDRLSMLRKVASNWQTAIVDSARRSSAIHIWQTRPGTRAAREMFLSTHSRAPSKWSYLLLALGFMVLGVGPVVLLTMHARVKPQQRLATDDRD